MRSRSPLLRVSRAVMFVWIVMVGSFTAYYGSRSVDHESLRVTLATFFGTTYFLSVSFGALYIWIIAYLAEVPPGWRVLACWINPFLWMTKEALSLLESHPLLECLYWYFNPLNLMLVLLVSFEMAAGTLLARAVLKWRGAALRILSPGAVGVIVGSLLAMVSAFTWGEGERLYVKYLEGYRWLFGSGL